MRHTARPAGVTEGQRRPGGYGSVAADPARVPGYPVINLRCSGGDTCRDPLAGPRRSALWQDSGGGPDHAPPARRPLSAGRIAVVCWLERDPMLQRWSAGRARGSH